MPALRYLSLRNNLFEGALKLSSCTNLTIVNLDHNRRDAQGCTRGCHALTA